MAATTHPTREAPRDLSADPRARMLDGLARAIVEKGYAATTIADVAANAQVSEETFTEQFADLESCCLALYSVVSDHMLEVIARAASDELPWRERLDAAMRAYLGELAVSPVLTRTFLIDVPAASERAVALRRDVLGRFAALLQALTRAAVHTDPALTALSQPMATAVVGAINELLLEAVEDGRSPQLPELADTATQLLRALVTAPAQTSAA
jgi:AcrR family transcriptional regulator